MLAAIPKQGKKYSSYGGTIPSLPPAIDKKQSHYAQELSRHEETIAQVVAKARKEAPVSEVVTYAKQGPHRATSNKLAALVKV